MQSIGLAQILLRALSSDVNVTAQKRSTQNCGKIVDNWSLDSI